MLKLRQRYPDYYFIYGGINDSSPKCIDYKNGIIHLSGKYLMEFLFGNDYEIIIKITEKVMKEKIDSHFCKSL